MKENELRARFPRASSDFIRENAAPDRPVSHPGVERDQAAALGATIPGKEKGVGRVAVRFIGYRVRPLDPDGFAGSVKDLLDGLRHAHLIPNDDVWSIIFTAEQRQVEHYCDEKTEIEILWP